MRAPILCSRRRVGLAAVLITTSASAAFAQLPNASAAAFGMAGNFTALARGFDAVAWNPANLALSGRPFLSFGTATIGGSLGLDPVDFKAMHEFSGQVVDPATRDAWVAEARLAGGEKVRIDGGITWLGLSVGPVGLQVGSSFYNNMNLSPDAFEAVLFGNADPVTLLPRTLDFTGTNVRGGVFTTGAMSFAFGLPFKFMGGMMPGERLAVGVTGKYVVGHGLIVAQDIGSTVGASDILLRFPTIGVRNDTSFGPGFDSDYNGVAGTGVAGDLSLAWEGGPWKVGALFENVFNGFKWDPSMLAFMPGTGTFRADSNGTDWDQQPFANAPQALRELVTGQKFAPAISIGGALKLTSRLTLTADMKTTTGGDETIVIGPRSRYGVGAELKIVPFVPLRAGVASVTDGWQAGLGAGFQFLGYELGASTLIRRRGAATEQGVMIGLVGLGR
jgi:hypothetical protein